MNETQKWKYYLLSFMACAGYSYNKHNNLYRDEWVDVAEMARQGDAWFWSTNKK